MNKSIILIIISIAISYNVYGREIQGTVFGTGENNEKTVLPKANVIIKDTKIGTLTNEFGKFSINTQESDVTLIISYVGYKKDTVIVPHNQHNIEVVLTQVLSSKTIIVEGQKPTQMISQSSMAKTEIITDRGLKKAACCNLSESFTTNPSVDVAYSDAVSGAKQIQLLGLSQVYTQIMTEKVPNLQGFASNQGLSYVPGPWMNAISISKGASSVSTGYESITGQINVDYKEPVDVDRLFFNGYTNDAFRTEGTLMSKYQLNDKVSTALMVHSNIYKGVEDRNSDGFTDIPQNTQFNILNRWERREDPWDSKILINAIYNEMESGQVNYLRNLKHNSYGIFSKVNRYNIFTKNGYVFPTEKYQSIGTIVAFTHNSQNSNFGNLNYDNEQNSLYVNLIWQSSFDSHLHNENESKSNEEVHHSYSLGFSYLNNIYNESLNDLNRFQRESVPGLFFEYTYAGIENLSVTPGIRVDFHNIYGTLFTPRLHIKYNLNPNNSIRMSVGKGYHNPLPIAENQFILASSRQIVFDENLDIERAWNFGFNTTSDFDIFGLNFTFNTEYYYTKFENQTITDMDSNPYEVHFYNLDGKSYAHSAQVDLRTDFMNGLILTTAYRFNDIKQTIGGKFEQKPLLSPSKFFANIEYSTQNDRWMFDFTVSYNSSGRIPSTLDLPKEYQLKNNFPGYFQLFGQITRHFDIFEIYLGGENLTNYRQPNPIIAPNDPFGKYFNSSYIWGPIMGRKIYAGIRLIIN
ncbi:MAG TPA: TonB-dependent receptor [Bacteroidota bacterium]|nr:TonB-dependent receptor [Bacteroidota bacterium]